MLISGTEAAIFINIVGLLWSLAKEKHYVSKPAFAFASISVVATLATLQMMTFEFFFSFSVIFFITLALLWECLGTYKTTYLLSGRVVNTFCIFLILYDQGLLLEWMVINNIFVMLQYIAAIGIFSNILMVFHWDSIDPSRIGNAVLIYFLLFLGGIVATNGLIFGMPPEFFLS
ncbi:hypothetical protein [Candidatus Borrarchaeum sp.]|uniref:hypothetical protein n=1 Tax=Candidatus Borrarchaeum sp. TaxID=2846742 RepID=UPI00257E1D3D|nr:hypothetical protein [Candidatus Borrarchaeum sp.]